MRAKDSGLDCEKWLRSELRDGELHLSENIREKAKESGFTGAELRTARKNLGAKTFHQFDEDGATENWFWYLEDGR
jgi:hypothetical protein